LDEAGYFEKFEQPEKLERVDIWREPNEKACSHRNEVDREARLQVVNCYNPPSALVHAINRVFESRKEVQTDVNYLSNIDYDVKPEVMFSIVFEMVRNAKP